MHKLRLVFYEAEKIKRFDWLIYPSRLLLSSIFESQLLISTLFSKATKALTFFSFLPLLGCEGDNLYRLQRESAGGARAGGWT